VVLGSQCQSVRDTLQIFDIIVEANSVRRGEPMNIVQRLGERPVLLLFKGRVAQTVPNLPEVKNTLAPCSSRRRGVRPCDVRCSGALEDPRPILGTADLNVIRQASNSEANSPTIWQRCSGLRPELVQQSDEYLFAFRGCVTVPVMANGNEHADLVLFEVWQSAIREPRRKHRCLPRCDDNDVPRQGDSKDRGCGSQNRENSHRSAK